MLECLNALESYLHNNDGEDPIVKIGLVHVQFETIHPFLDGNGRLGRLLISLLLEAWDLLDARLLYISLYFKRHQQEYYRRLDAVRREGDFEGWIQFFVEGVCSASFEAIQSAELLFRLIEKDRKALLAYSKASIPALRLFQLLPHHPLITTSQVVKLLETTKPTAAKAIEVLRDVGILAETTGAKRNQMFGYKKYIEILGRADI